jgi:branched-chain amino acid transport system permease protein
MQNNNSYDWKKVVSNGLIGGGISVLLCLIGMILSFDELFIVNGIVTMGQILLFAFIFLFSYLAANQITESNWGGRLAAGILSSLIGGVILAILVSIGQVVNLRAMFNKASPDLYQLLLFGRPFPAGLIPLTLIALLVGAVAAGVSLLPSRLRGTLIGTFVWVTLIGLMRDLLVTVINRWGAVAKLFLWPFALSGLSLAGAIILLVIIGVILYWRSSRLAKGRANRQSRQRQLLARGGWVIGIGIGLILLPVVLGSFFSEILDNAGIYILMGLGLNIVVGFAGLLDLGYVAFYAIGAYTMGLLTSPEVGLFNLTFWQALPFALVAAVLAGILLGLPVLKMRGDYLAIVTMGFGEIIRILALSDWLRPLLGASQGIQQIARPHVGSLELATQGQLYYLIVAGIGVAGFIAWRLKDSRMGRSWMAVREDEDVAQAMGINLVTTKLMAFGMGALFSGLGGAIFAAKVASVYPQSFNLFVSINVLCLIIIGGMGSIPGVFVGGLALMGLPELLRQFADYRYLAYGAVLVAMMLIRPEGLWPEARRKLELHEAEELEKADIEEVPEPAPAAIEMQGQ